MNATSIPWQRERGTHWREVIGPNGEPILMIRSTASDADFLVGAVNAHAAMREALQAFVDHYAGDNRVHLGTGFASQWYDTAKAALAAVEKG